MPLPGSGDRGAAPERSATGLFAGPDQGGAASAACVIDAAGAAVARSEAAHDTEGVAVPAAGLPAAVERASGLLVDAPTGAGRPVAAAVHPDVIEACRPRHRAARRGGSNPGGAFRPARPGRGGGHRFQPLSSRSDEVEVPRALVRAHDGLLAERAAPAGRPSALLERSRPSVAAILAAVASPIGLASLRRHPAPESAARLGEERLAAFLAQHAYCGRRSPAEPLARLRAAPTGRVGGAEAEAEGDELVGSLAAVLGALASEVARLATHVELMARVEHEPALRPAQPDQGIAALPGDRVVASFPRAGQVCVARTRAEPCDVPERFRTGAQLAAEAGVCPVTRQSGKSRGATSRRACDYRLRWAATCPADGSHHASA